MLHTIPEGREISRNLIGAKPASLYIDDFDKDGDLDLITTTTTPDNGAIAGGYSDQEGYWIKFNLPDLSIEDSHTYPPGRVVGEMFYEDLDADYNKELLMHIRSGLEILEPSDLSVKYRQTVPSKVSVTTILNFGNDVSATACTSIKNRYSPCWKT